MDVSLQQLLKLQKELNSSLEGLVRACDLVNSIVSSELQGSEAGRDGLGLGDKAPSDTGQRSFLSGIVIPKDTGLVSKAEWHAKFVEISQRASESKRDERLYLLKMLRNLIDDVIKKMETPEDES